MANPTVNVIIQATSRVASTLQAIQQQVQQAGAGIKQKFDQAFQGGKGFVDGLFGDVKGIIPRFAAVGLAIDGVQKAFGVAQQAGQSFYDNLIKPNVELQQQLLATKATLVATNQVLQGGIQIQDPTAAIKALGAPVEAALADIRQGSLELVGVTSSQLVPIFQNIAGQSAAIGATLKQAGDLTLTFAAALGTLNIPLDQQRQEVSSILQGQIDQNSALAKALNITNDQVKSYKAQGTLVEQLTTRLSAFRAGNKLAAQTIEGIGSNITELFDLIKLDVGAPFLDSIVKGLDQVYQFLSRNRAEIQTFVSTVATSLFTVGTVALDVGKSIAQLFGGESGFKQGLEVVQLFASGATSAIVGLGEVANTVIDSAAKNPAFQIFAKAVEIGVDGIKRVGEAAGEVTGATGAFNDALASTEAVTAQTREKATALAKTLKDLGDQEKINGSLTAEQKQQRLDAGKAAAIQTDALGDQINAYKDLAKQYPDQAAGIQVTIKELEKLRAQLGDVKLKSLPVPEKGTALDQIQKELTNFQNVLKSGTGDPKTYEDAGKGAISAVQALRAEGAITAKEAAEQLKSLTSATNLPKETILSARKELIKQLGEIDQDRLDEIKADQVEVDALVQRGDVSEIEGIEATAKLKSETLDLELARANEIHDAKIKLIQDELAANLKLADVKVKAAEAALATANQSGDNVAIAQRTRELQAETAKRVAFETAANKETELADQDVANKRKTINAKRIQDEVDTQRKIVAARLTIIDRNAAQAEDAVAKSRLDRELELNQEFLAGNADRTKARQTENKGKLDDIQAEIAANKAKTTALEALPKSNNPQDEERRENLIRDSKRKTTELTLKLIDEEIAQRKRAIDDQLQAQKNLLVAQQLPLQRQVDLSGLYVKSLEIQQRLLSAKSEILKSINEYQQGEYSLAIKLAGVQDTRRQRELQRRDAELKLLTATTDEEAEQAKQGIDRLDAEERQRQLQIEAAKAKLVALEKEQELERETAALEAEKTIELQKQEELKLRIAAIDAKIGTADAAGEVAKLKADPKASQAQIDAANEKLQSSRQKEALIVDEQKLQSNVRASNEEQAESKRRALANKQALEQDNARGDLATLDPSGQAARQQSFEAQAKARSAQTDSPGASIEKRQQAVQTATSLSQDTVATITNNPAIDTKQQVELLAQIRDGIEAQKRGGQPTSATINNYFTGAADKGAVQDASQQTLATLKRVLNLAGATGT